MAKSDQLPALQFPVMVGPAPLLAVTKFTLKEGYETAALAPSAGPGAFLQLTQPTAKTITISAELLGPWRALRPALEALALTARGLGTPLGPVEAIAGVFVVTSTSVHTDMQITSLNFEETTEKRNVTTVTIELKHAPRRTEAAAFQLGADVVAGVASPLLSAFAL
jgi:hypothetical protein